MNRILGSIALLVLSATAIAAQTPTRPPDVDEVCLGFAFGTWRPALNWAEAGHQPVTDTTVWSKAPGGRDWAVNGTKTEGDTTFILFPMWWPAGVVVSLEHVPKSPIDSVRGQAIAMVADARKAAPTTAIRAWMKSCHA